MWDMICTLLLNVRHVKTSVMCHIASEGIASFKRHTFLSAACHFEVLHLLFRELPLEVANARATVVR